MQPSMGTFLDQSWKKSRVNYPDNLGSHTKSSNVSHRADSPCIWSEKDGDIPVYFAWVQRGFEQHQNISHAQERNTAVVEKDCRPEVTLCYLGE